MGLTACLSEKEVEEGFVTDGTALDLKDFEKVEVSGAVDVYFSQGDTGRGLQNLYHAEQRPECETLREAGGEDAKGVYTEQNRCRRRREAGGEVLRSPTDRGGGVGSESV